MVTINKMREMLCEGFPEPQADLMARVFVSAHDELVTKAELNELTAVMRDLAEAQKRTDEAQRRTVWAVKDLAKQVGGLSAALGGSLEDFACDLVPELLEKYWAMVVESAGSLIQAVDTEHTLPSGLGSRHAAAAAISLIAQCIAIVVSSSAGQVTLFRRGVMLPLTDKRY